MSKNYFPRRRDCRGEHCSPAAISGNVRFHGSIWNAPLREPKRPPCVKGAGCAAAQTEGLRPYGYNPTRPYTLQSLRHGLRRATRLRVGPLCRCATSPHTVVSHPLHKGDFTVSVGASIARPLNLTLPPYRTGEHCSPLRPLAHWSRREESCNYHNLIS